MKLRFIKIFYAACQLLLVTDTIAQNSSLPKLKWVDEFKSAFGTGGSQGVVDCAIDSASNVFILGNFTDTIDFDPGPGNVKLYSAFDDQFIIKLNAAGKLEWITLINNSLSGHADASKLAIDSAGNVFVAGSFEGIVDFDSGAGSFTMSVANSARDGFLIKLNSSGGFITGWDFDGRVEVNDLVVYLSQNVVIAGYFIGVTDFDPSLTTFALNSGTVQNGFIVNLTNNGLLQWAKKFASIQNGYVSDISLDLTGNFFLGGYASSNTDFDPGLGVTSNTSNSGFVVKLDGNGNFLLARFFEGFCRISSLEYSRGVIVAGSFNGTIDIDPSPNTLTISSSGSNDGFFLKLDSAGNFLWHQILRGQGSSEIGLKVQISGGGDIHLLSCFGGTFDFDPGVSTLLLSWKTVTPQLGYRDFGSAKYDSAGNLYWAYSIGACFAREIPAAVVSPSGDIYSSAIFGATIDFDPSSSTSSISPTKGKSFFAQKLSYCTELDEPQLSIYPYKTQICKGESTTINVYGQANSYFWGAGLGSAPVLQITPSVTTIYEATGIDKNGCYSTVSVQINVMDCLGMNDYTNEQFFIYPNPAHEILFIRTLRGTTIEILDPLGKIIMTEILISDTIKIDISSLEQGIYLIRLRQNNSSYSEKTIIKQ